MTESLKASLLPDRPLNWDNLDVLHQHPELHHYTTSAGLQGILATNTIWATHFSDLNDASELTLIRTPLEAALATRLHGLIRSRCRQSLRARRAVEIAGGLHRASRDSATRMVALLYASTFTEENGFQGVKALKGPSFIASFCTHTSYSESYERDNGLLSQWRGYGGAGGYCIVFDTKLLFELLEKEHAAFSYMNMAIDPVHYLMKDADFAEVFPEVLSACGNFFEHMLNDEEGLPEDIFTDFIRSATFCKHHAFHEEREVRIAVRPATNEWREQLSQEGQWYMPPSRTIVGDAPRRIVLFDNIESKLPIKRIIVGPSREQERNLSVARSVVGKNVQVILSETPFVERHWGDAS
jgi:hypothetical protein